MSKQFDKIWLSPPHMSGDEQQYIKDAFESNWIAPLGPNVNSFETDVSSYIGMKHCAVLSSGTAALHLGLALLDVQADDVVICQSMTFVASANPILYRNAIPVFVDSEIDSWNMSPDALEEAIRMCLNGTLKRPDGTTIPPTKPKAIIPVHLYGMPANIIAIKTIADSFNIPILEDAADSLGSSVDGNKCGSFGKLSVLSFNGNKIITTSGGGALLSNDLKTINAAHNLASQARDEALHYQHSKLGYNYRMSNVLAGIGRGQMQVLNERINRRRANFERYHTFFSKTKGINSTSEVKGIKSNRWLSSFTFDAKETGVTPNLVISALQDAAIEARPFWKPMHLQPLFKNAAYVGEEVAETVFSKGVCLPSGSSLTDADFDRIFSVLQPLLTR